VLPAGRENHNQFSVLGESLKCTTGNIGRKVGIDLSFSPIAVRQNSWAWKPNSSSIHSSGKVGFLQIQQKPGSIAISATVNHEGWLMLSKNDRFRGSIRD
jgi:hypothetical protein